MRCFMWKCFKNSGVLYRLKVWIFTLWKCCDLCGFKSILCIPCIYKYVTCLQVEKYNLIFITFPLSCHGACGYSVNIVCMESSVGLKADLLAVSVLFLS